MKRERYLMPKFIRDALVERELVDAYGQRPPYQQNDYIGWITHAKKSETQQKRLAQMINELDTGDRYMKMPYQEKQRGK